MSDDDEKLGLSRQLKGRLRSLRNYLDKVNYYLPPSHKAAIYSQLEAIYRLVLDAVENGNKNEINLSSFGKAYSQLMSAISTMGPTMDSGEKSEVRNGFRMLLTSTVQLELTMRGYNVEGMEEDEADTGLTADELMEMMA